MPIIHTQFKASTDDLRFRHFQQWRVDCDAIPFYPCLSRQISHLLKCLNELRATIGVSTVVECVDTNENALEGLKKGLNFSKSKHKYEIIHQNLLKRPIDRKLLNEMDTIVLNPPSKGAKKQINEIVKSDVKKLAYVSCNFKTFENDANVLVSNDFVIDWIKPIDQFPYTNHLEIVAKFIKTG